VPLHRGVEGTMGLNIKQSLNKEGGLSPPHKEEGHKGVKFKILYKYPPIIIIIRGGFPFTK